MSSRSAVAQPTSPPDHGPRPQGRRIGLVLSAFVLVALLGAIVIVSPRPASAPFTVQVVPTGVGDAIPGQSIVLLATYSDDGTAADEADVAAVPLEHRDQVAVSVVPGRIAAAEVAEITVVIDESVVADLPDGEPLLGRPAPIRTPDDERRPIEPQPGPVGPEGVTVPVRVTVTRGGTVESADVSINVSPGEDTPLEAATSLRDRFVSWLATERPELGITADTQWTPTIVQPHILVVSHYLFFSEDWEMGLMWHIMIPPHDWSRIYLRPRQEMAPTMAFEIPSVSDPTSSIRDIPAPTQVDR